MDALLMASSKVFGELYNELTPLMTAIMYGAPLVTIKQLIEFNASALAIKSTLGWVCNIKGIYRKTRIFKHSNTILTLTDPPSPCMTMRLLTIDVFTLYY